MVPNSSQRCPRRLDSQGLQRLWECKATLQVCGTPAGGSLWHLQTASLLSGDIVSPRAFQCCWDESKQQGKSWTRGEAGTGDRIQGLRHCGARLAHTSR